MEVMQFREGLDSEAAIIICPTSLVHLGWVLCPYWCTCLNYSAEEACQQSHHPPKGAFAGFEEACSSGLIMGVDAVLLRVGAGGEPPNRAAGHDWGPC